MKTCDCCGSQNIDDSADCIGCGKPLQAEPTKEDLLLTPRHLQLKIWDYFAVKRGRFYTAGLLIGLFPAAIAFLTGKAHGMDAVFLGVAIGGAGMGAVFYLKFMERLKVRIEQSRKEGNPTFGIKLLSGIIGFVVLVALAVLIVVVCGVFIL
jgi:hypothetical protein